MNIKIQHTHTREEARRRVTTLINKLKRQYGDQIQNLNEEWTDYTGTIEGSAKGYSLSGTIDVKEDVLDIDLKLPFLLQVFGNKIRSVVEEQVKKELSDGKA
ncbi:MAG TPA: polyhydroxyalkanoic acid system family protein [Puia sp.]|nr:polyhydroxyalkanoic acid system family protein [Puia sp.]